MNKNLLSCLLLFVLASPLASAQSPSPTPVTQERSIYLPYEELEQVFENEGRGVFLPYKEFLEMWNKVNLPEAVKKSQPPVDGILASANYTGKVSGEVVTLQAKLDFEALKEGWSALSLGTTDMNISEAKTTATLNYSPESGYQIIFPDKGRYGLEMTILGKITKDAGRNSVKLNLPRTAVSQFEITVPDKGLDFTITPACAFTTNEQPDGTTKLAVFFGASQEINISWQKRGGETALKPLLFVETMADTRVSAGALHTNLSLNYRILRSGVDQFEVLIPPEQQVLSVDGQNLRDWTLEKSGEKQRLLVNLHTPARDNYSFSVAMETAIASLPAKLELPLIEVQNVERQSGVINLSRDGELVADIGKLDGLSQQFASEGGKESAVRIGQYRYLRLPYTLDLSVANAQPLIEVESETLLTVEPEIQTLRGKFNYEVKKAGIFSTQIELPDGFDKAEANGAAVESSSVQKEGAKQVLTVKFNSRKIGKFAFEVTADAIRKTPDEALAVPVFRPRDVQRHEGKVGVAVHVSLKASTADAGDLRQEDIRNLGDMQVTDPGTTPLTLGFRYHGDVKAAQLAFEMRKPRVSAEVLALMEVREALIKNTWWIRYDVEYAGVNEFSIAVPKEIADDIQIDGANIKERSKSEDAKKPGQVIWKVSLQDKNLGAYDLKISLERPRGAVKSDQAVSVNLPEIQPLDLFRETGQIAVVKDGNLEFTKTDAKGAEFIDPKELHGQLQQNGVFLAYKYATHPVSLSLDVAKNLYLDVPTALVTYAVINSVVAEDKAQTTEVVYWVRNNAQQFITVRLPENGKMLADVYVKGELQQPSRRPSQNEMLIRLPVQQGGGGDTVFPVRFVYEVPSTHPGSGLWPRGTITIQPPVLADTEIMQTQWTLFLPSGYHYVKFAGPMREHVSERRGWNVFHRVFDRFVPGFGLLSVQQNVAAQTPPSLPAGQNGGVDFQIPQEGQSVVLHRLDGPAEVAVSYRSLTYYYTIEAILFFVTLFFGIRLTGASREAKFAYVFFIGIGALIIAGAVDPRGAGKWHVIYLGVFVSALIWLAGGTTVWIRKWVKRVRERKRVVIQEPPPIVSPIVPPIAEPPVV